MLYDNGSVGNLTKVPIVNKNQLTIVGLGDRISSVSHKWLTSHKRCGSVGTGRRARLRILCILLACGFKSHLPHCEKVQPKG